MRWLGGERNRYAAAMLLIDIAELIAVPAGPLTGAAMRNVTRVADAALATRDGRIAWFGARDDTPAEFRDEPRVSAGGRCVVPGLIDCHTHIPFAGQRAGEFVRRVAGESYLSIMQSGGGIRVSTRAVRESSLESLVTENLPRLQRMLARGVTTCECKSGYGLSPEAEVRQLHALKELAATQPVELIPTYLGAHALPAEFEGRPDDFIESIASEVLLREIAEAGLARFCDVFCDRGAFTVEQARRVLTRARAAGLKLKLHADELAQIGASRLAGELRAVSADHLEVIDDAGIAALRAGGTVAVALPGTSFVLGIEHCPARKLIDSGLALAIATDFNPGSCPIESLPLVMHIACCQLRLLPIEVLTACTANAAAAIDETRRLGAIAVGHDADLAVLDAPSLDEWFYRVGRGEVAMTIKRGEIVSGAAA